MYGTLIRSSVILRSKLPQGLTLSGISVLGLNLVILMHTRSQVGGSKVSVSASPYDCLYLQVHAYAGNMLCNIMMAISLKNSWVFIRLCVIVFTQNWEWWNLITCEACSEACQLASAFPCLTVRVCLLLSVQITIVSHYKDLRSDIQSIFILISGGSLNFPYACVMMWSLVEINTSQNAHLSDCQRLPVVAWQNRMVLAAKLLAKHVGFLSMIDRMCTFFSHNPCSLWYVKPHSLNDEHALKLLANFKAKHSSRVWDLNIRNTIKWILADNLIPTIQSFVQFATYSESSDIYTYWSERSPQGWILLDQCCKINIHRGGEGGSPWMGQCGIRKSQHTPQLPPQPASSITSIGARNCS